MYVYLIDLKCLSDKKTKQNPSKDPLFLEIKHIKIQRILRIMDY